MKKISVVILFLFPIVAFTQGVRWSQDGSSYYTLESNEIVKYVLPDQSKKVVISSRDLTPEGSSQALRVRMYSLSADESKVLIFTNTKKVWRLDTRGDYWVLDVASK